MSSPSFCSGTATYTSARWTVHASVQSESVLTVPRTGPRCHHEQVAGRVQVPALQGQGAPDVEKHANIPLKKLPHDSQGQLLRPGVVW